MSSFLTVSFAIATAVGFYNFGNAYFAYINGDDTAYKEGRMTPNPLGHLNTFGLLMMITMGVGFTCSIPIDETKFKNRKRGIILSALGGPIFNLLVAIVSTIIMSISSLYGVHEVLSTVVEYNISFASFNLVPVLPRMAGWKILKEILPRGFDELLCTCERYSLIIFIIMIVSKIYLLYMNPIYNALSKIVALFNF